MTKQTKQQIKLIDVKTHTTFKGICSNCNRKLKNEYILSNNKSIGCECIIKVLGDDLKILDKITTLNYKLSVIKFILNKCKKILISNDVLKDFNNPEYKTYFYVWLYDDLNKHFAQFKYRFTREGLKPFLSYIKKNKDIIIINDETKLKEVLK